MDRGNFPRARFFLDVDLRGPDHFVKSAQKPLSVQKAKQLTAERVGLFLSLSP
jgi:hypothetical protein